MLRKTLRNTFLLVLAILLSAEAFAAASGAGDKRYVRTEKLAAGFTYMNEISYTASALREEAFKLTREPGSKVHPIVMGCDTIYGGLTAAQMTAYAESIGMNVVAVINSDLFSTATKVPLGIVVEDGRYKSSPEGEAALCFDADGNAFIVEDPSVSITLYNNGQPKTDTGEAEGTQSEAESGQQDRQEAILADGAGESVDGNESDTVYVDNTGKKVQLTHFNKYRTDTGGLYLFDSSFSTVSTRTSTDGWMVRFRILEGEMRVSGKLELEVTEICSGPQAQPIGSGYLILTAAAAGGYQEECDKFAVGDAVTLTLRCADESLTEAAWATGVADVLISGGTATDASGRTDSMAQRHPRTAVGMTPDGTLIAYVIDGRRSAYSNGLTYRELTQELLGAGCVWAVNLDGGGSSVMSIRMPGQQTAGAVSSPSDGSERKCGAYILFVTDGADGGAASLHLAQNGTIILVGSQTELSFLAMDGALRSTALPEAVEASSSGLGVIEGSRYFAGTEAGVDTITLSSPDAQGSGEIFIITDPDSISVKREDTGKAVTSMVLKRGETVRLLPSCTFLGKSVVSDTGAYTYSASEEIGTITEDGVFTAGNASDRSGEIIVTAGDTRCVIPVTIPSEFEDIEGHWAKEYILNLFSKGVVNGVSGTTFAPDATIRRGDFILMLYRAAGMPESEIAGIFDDVAEDAYYAKAVEWAASAGIAQGMGDGLFEPDRALTREQAFTFIYRAFDCLEIEAPETSDEALAPFTDADELSDYAMTPTAALVTMHVVGGDGGYLTPNENFTRGQMAKVLSLLLTA